MRVAFAGALVAGALIALGAMPTGCGADSRDLFVTQYDAGVDGNAQAADAEPEVDPTIGGPCTEDVQCDDLIACTYDLCDKAISRCRNTPDDTQCDDNVYCNGQEKCRLRQGCVAGPVVSCQDDDNCTIDRCVEATKQCQRVPRDSDGDGDPDDHCSPKADCDDTDPTVSSKSTEICGNFKDDNCDGQIDEQPCASPANDTCSSALDVRAPGTFLLTTVASAKNYSTSCSVSTPAAARDIVLAITVPPDTMAKDVTVRAQTSQDPTEVAVAIERVCGDSATELGCGHTAGIASGRAIARTVTAGSTVYAIVTTQTEAQVSVTVEITKATDPPANESCSAPTPEPVNTPFVVKLIDAKKDLPSLCDDPNLLDHPTTGELTYTFDLAQISDVHVFASVQSGSGAAVVSLRGPTCADELHCQSTRTLPLFVRSMQPGKYFLSVAGTSQLEASVVVKTDPPSPSPLDENCATAPALVPNKTVNVSLAGHQNGIVNGCVPGWPNAAGRLDLTVASDVLLVGRVPSGDIGGLSLNLPGCQKADLLPNSCSQGAYGPIRVSKRNVSAGSYRVVVADQNGQSQEIVPLVRPTVAPVTVTADTCANPAIIPEAGGFFTGDTTTATANYGAGCDATGQGAGGAKEQMLQLTLTEERRVIFDMSGSAFSTLLVVRTGVPCPGVQVESGCHAGTSADRSFLDLKLPPGTYWVQVDGYGGAAGTWNLDVRVLPP